MTASDYDETMQLLCDRLGSLVSSDTPITPESNLIGQLAIDSIKLLNLIMEIEDTFDISVPINALADVQTVRDLVDLIHKIKSA
ncbi:MAG: acyl carrier protein [Nitrosomonas sp.]|nr:acyl carrier protein [Nitrosomonas sp.]